MRMHAVPPFLAVRQLCFVSCSVVAIVFIIDKVSAATVYIVATTRRRGRRTRRLTILMFRSVRLSRFLYCSVAVTVLIIVHEISNVVVSAIVATTRGRR